MRHKIRTKWLNQIQEVVKETWIRPPSSVTSFPAPECKLVCAYSSAASLWSGRSFGPRAEGISTCAINEHRPEKASTAGPCVASVWQINLLACAICRQPDLFTVSGCRYPTWVALTHGARLGRMPAALFRLGRLYT